MPLVVLVLCGLLSASTASAAKRELQPTSVGKRLITFKLDGIEPRAIRSARLYDSSGKRRIRRSVLRRAARSGVLKLRRRPTRASAPRSSRSVGRRPRLVVVTDTSSPKVSWRKLTQGQTVSGVFDKKNGKCRVRARDNVGVRRVDFYLDGKRIRRDTRAPYACRWDTRTAKGGWHRLAAVAVDGAGRRATSSIDVGVSPAPPPAGRLVFQDNFDGPSVNRASWRPYQSPGHAGNGLRRPSAFSQGNGLLAVTASWDGTNITSGGMSHRANYTYGSFEFRARTEQDVTGQLSGVVLTWPQSNRKLPDGENDIYETTAAASRSRFYSFVHYGMTDRQYGFANDADATQWHTMRMDWTPSSIKIYRDGFLSHTLTDPAAIADVPHHMAIQLDAFANRPLAKPVRMYVDWVKIYR